MFPELNSVANERILRKEAEHASSVSARLRQDYISAMQNRVGDDQIKHIHYDAMDAHTRNMNAHNRMLGIRPYQLID